MQFPFVMTLSHDMFYRGLALYPSHNSAVIHDTASFSNTNSNFRYMCFIDYTSSDKNR